MSDTQALAMLALRRIHGPVAVPAGLGTPAADDADAGDPAGLTAGDRVALGRVLRRAVDRTWLTLELLFCQETVGPRLGRGGQQTLDALFTNPCFAHLTVTPGPFRQTVWRELHAARKNGPLAPSDVDVDDLLRQVSGLSRPTDPRAGQDLEWYALWQAAGQLARQGYAELRSLFEARATDGGSLLIGLVTSFVPFELALEGHRPPRDLPGLLSDAEIRWLCEHSEHVELWLKEAYGGSRSETPAEVAAHMRQGQLYAQQGEYERAIIEYTAALQSDLTIAAPFVHRGDAFRHRGEYDRAVADYTQALRLEPTNRSALLNRGLVYRLTGKSAVAIADLTEALRLDPRNVAALNGRGAAHADLGRYDLAIADHTQALRLDPSLAWAYQSRGDAYAGRAEYDRAIADYTEALRLNPHFPLAHSNRGDAYRLAGDLDRAAADYTEALRLDPLNPRTYTSRGETYRRQGRYDLALADFGEVIRLDPTNPTGYLNRGIVYQLTGDHGRAVANFNLAEQFDPSNPQVFYQRAMAYQRRESFEDAIRDLGRVIELNPRDAVALISRGNLYALIHKYDRAGADFTEAITLDPLSAPARLERARLYGLSGAFAAALDDCREALRLDPQLVPARLVLGGVLLRTGEYAAALTEFNRAIDINPRYARAFNDRGVVSTKLGQLDQAIADFTRAIELSPEYSQALSNRGNALQLQGRHEEALQDFTRAVALDAKYAAAYSLVRGLAEAARGNHLQAVADYTVALALDPKNRVARTALSESKGFLESDFELSPSVSPLPARPAGISTSLRVPAAPTQAAPPVAAKTGAFELEVADESIVDEATPTVAGAPDTQVAVVTVTDADHAAAEAERRAELAAQEQARLRALAEKAAELRRQNEVAEIKQKAEADKKRKKKGGRRDLDEEREVWRKRKQAGMFVAASLVLLYYLVPFIWDMLPKAPPSKITAEQLAEQYSRDAQAANDEFAGKPLVVVGKLRIEKPKRRAFHPSEVKVFFDVPGERKVTVQCELHDEDDISKLKPDTTYRITGTVDKYIAGRPVVLKNCHPYEEKTAARARNAGRVAVLRDAINQPSTGRMSLPQTLMRYSHHCS